MNLDIVYYARVVGATGAYAAAVGSGLGTIPNPIADFPGSAVAARTGAGVYTITFDNALPIGEFLYEAGLEAAAVDGNVQISVAGAVVTVRTSLAAVATDENFWLRISRVLAAG